MTLRSASALLGIALFLSCCRKPAEVTVREERPFTMRDGKPVLDATSDQRFGDPGTEASGPFVATQVPDGWLEMPANQFRLLNYRFGTGGEVAVGLSAGGLAENVNRWLGQFGADPLTEDALAALEKGTVTGVDGVWVEASGLYSAGMGQPPKDGQALYGIVAEASGRVITVKMTGPADEVAAQKDALKLFVAGLTLRAE